MRYARNIFALALLLAIASPGRASAQVSVDIRMTPDRTSVGAGEPFDLQIRADVSGARPSDITLPDLSAFRITSRRVSRPMQFTFGFGNQTQVVRSTIVYDLTLVPLNEGSVRIDPASIQAGGRTFRSDPVTIEVGPGTGTAPPDPGIGQRVPTPPSGQLDGAEFDETAFLRTTVTPTDPYVGQQVTVTVYLYVRGSIRSSPVIHREPNADGFWVHDLLPAARTLEGQRQMVGGQQFNVYLLRRFAAFPLSEGDLEIGAMDVSFETGSIFDIFNARRSGRIRRRGVPVQVTSRPLPAAGRPDGEIHVGTYRLEASLDRASAATGDAVTLTARVEGTGNLRDIRLTLPEVDGLRILEPEVTDQISATNDVVGGGRTFAWLIVPERAGEYRLPELALSTFSPATGTYTRVVGPELTLTAAGAAVASEEPEEDEAEEGEESRAPELGPVRTRSELNRNPPVERLPFWMWALFAIPPLAWLLAVFFGFARRRLDERGERDAPKRAVRSAKKRLATAESHAKEGDARAFYGEVRKVIKDVLEARLGEAVGGYTHNELEKILRRRGMDEDLSRRVVDELEGTEFAQYSAEGASTDEMVGCSQRVGALLERMDRFSPVLEELR
jgi:hypothetical protein